MLKSPCSSVQLRSRRTPAVTCMRAHRAIVRIENKQQQQHALATLHVALSSCSASLRQLWTAAGQQQQHWQQRHLPGLQQSLSIGIGVGTVACNGIGGTSGPPGGSGWGSGGGGGSSGSSPGNSSGFSNVMADIAAGNEAPDAVQEEVLLLDVGGMKCGGCVGHVKQLLEQQAAVTSATVNLATETALVRVRLPAGADLDKLAAELAKALTKAGFASKPRPRRGTGWVSDSKSLDSKRQQKLDRLHKTTQDLIMAWGLSLLCGLGHLGHMWPAAPAWMHALHHPVLAGALSVAALLGPGRDIISSGAQALAAGRPDMNSLVGLGATASFAVSCVAAALPVLRWKTFFEEPAMLLGFVLVGRALEERAKLQASSDMAALQGLMPQTARLTLGHTSAAAASQQRQQQQPQQQGLSAAAASSSSSTTTTNSSRSSSGSSVASSSSSSWVEVPADAVGPGDVLLVLPGDRVPVDGTVVNGRSTIDESALTGEPLPLIKEAGAKVTAGTLNCDGSLLVSAEASGQDTVIADIVRMVEAAQARTAPIQRLADSVAGKFAYGVMSLSAATFAFWSTFGARAFPQVLATAAGAGAGGAAAAAAGACCCPPAAGAAAAAAAAGGSAAAVTTGGTAAAVLLGLQLACNVMVVACPCALGLATPTAVLVGTAAGARKGLLVRGGDILEATSQVDTVVFDKTGTLTAGRPVVAGITMFTASPLGPQGNSSSSSSQSSSHTSSSSAVMSPSCMLQLAAAVERQATHPVAKALVAAAAADRAATAASAAADSSSSGSSGGSWTSQNDIQQQLAERRASHAAASSSSGSSSGGGSSSSRRFASGVTPEVAAALAAGDQLNPEANSFLQEPGSGAVAVVAGHMVSVGTLEWVQRHGAQLTSTTGQQQHQHLQAPAATTAQQTSSSSSSGRSVQEPLTGHTQVYVGVDDVIVGLVDVADVIRPDARSTVDELHQSGIRTIMLSGDRREAAEKVAAAVGISPSDVHAGIKPAGKAALIEQLKSQGLKVAMVGDGINDTAALAAADVGMAMAGGVDAASDVAKVVLMGDQLHQVYDAIELSRKTLSKIQQNLGWAFCYNLVGIPLAAGALLPKYGISLTPSISGALMGFSSLAVMANSLVLQLEVHGLRNGLVTAQARAAAAATGAVGVGSAGHVGGINSKVELVAKQATSY